MKKRRLSMLLVALLGITALFGAGCAADADGEDDEDLADDEMVSATSEALVNQSAPGTKLCAYVVDETELYVHPGGGSTVFDDAARAKLNRGRYVLVQQFPGRVRGYVWADPDLYGFHAAKDWDDLAERCGVSRATVKSSIMPRTLANKYGLRGWVPARALKMHPKAKWSQDIAKLPGRRPLGPAYGRNDLKDGKPRTGAERTIKADCAVPTDVEYIGSDPKNPTGFGTYGTVGRPGILVSYGTPEIDGGGVSFGYIPNGATFHELGRRAHTSKGEHRVVPSTGKFMWAWGWADVRGWGRVRGWVAEACLE